MYSIYGNREINCVKFAILLVINDDTTIMI